MSYYVAINERSFLENGEIVLESAPMSFWEIFEFEERDGEKEPYTHFGVHGISELCDLINALGGKRGKFISYLITRKNNENQITNKSVSELSREVGVSMQTANDALSILREIGLVKTSPTNLMISPRLDRRGNKRRSAFLMNLYAHFQERRKNFSGESEKDIDSGMLT